MEYQSQLDTGCIDECPWWRSTETGVLGVHAELMQDDYHPPWTQTACPEEAGEENDGERENESSGIGKTSGDNGICTPSDPPSPTILQTLGENEIAHPEGRPLQVKQWI